MLEFFFFMLILLGFIAGMGAVYVLVARLSGRVGKGEEAPALPLLRDELDALSVRLGRVEEELDFYKKLKTPDPGKSIGPPPGAPDQDD